MSPGDDPGWSLTPNSILRFRVGRVVTIRTKDGHELCGRVSFSAPERVILAYAGGLHVVFTGAISSYRNHDVSGR